MRSRTMLVSGLSLLLVVLHAQGAAVPGSAGTKTLSAGPSPEGLSLTVQVDYGAFDGQSASDPLGITPGETQYAYLLEYLAGNDKLYAYDVESVTGVPLLRVATSTSGTVNGRTVGTMAPTGRSIVTLANGHKAARFLYSRLGDGTFGPAGAKSVFLVFTAAAQYPVGMVTCSMRDNSLTASDTVTGPEDKCPDDPNKAEPGVCGCGIPDTDTDGDGVADCQDLCPNDPNKVAPGLCGCGAVDTDTDGDGTPNCNDLCPDDPEKTAPGACGCGIPDVDGDGDGVPD